MTMKIKVGGLAVGLVCALLVWQPQRTCAYISANGKLMLGHIQTFKFSANDKSAEYLKTLTDELPAIA